MRNGSCCTLLRPPVTLYNIFIGGLDRYYFLIFYSSVFVGDSQICLVDGPRYIYMAQRMTPGSKSADFLVSLQLNSFCS